jgi:hypothetical protein
MRNRVYALLFVAIVSSIVTSAAQFPNVPKPTPQFNPNWPCPPQGNGGDPQLSKLKNRIDDGDFQAVEFDLIKSLPFPIAVAKKQRSTWTASQKKALGKFEGTPISIEGFLAIVNNSLPNQPPKLQGGREEGKEACNCGFPDSTFHDFHVWILAVPDTSRKDAIVVEITPPVRSKHPNWNLNKLTQIANAKQKVRISGWLVLDQEHPEQIGKTRASLWEIHPIIKIEVESNGAFTTLN